MSGVLKLAAFGVTAALCAAVLRKQAPELKLALVLAAGAAILTLALGAVEEVAGFLDELAETAGLAPAVLAPVMKVVGISIVSRTAGQLCRDAQEGGLACFVETAAAALALVAAIPLLRAVLSTVTGLI